MNYYSIAIDGPAGAGKSTIAKRIASFLGYTYIDTGAMYRAMGLFFTQNGKDPDNDLEASAACREVDVTLAYIDDIQQVYLNGENVTNRIRTEEAGKMASLCSKNPEIREKMVELQQEMARKENVVMDGRDIGTVVLPNADLKIFMTASVSIRAKRRFIELQGKGVACDINDIEKDIEDRDRQDSTRKHSPLRKADDALIIDTSELDIDETVNLIVNIFKERIN